jgi:hypothetical protein
MVGLLVQKAEKAFLVCSLASLTVLDGCGLPDGLSPKMFLFVVFRWVERCHWLALAAALIAAVTLASGRLGVVTPVRIETV